MGLGHVSDTLSSHETVDRRSAPPTVEEAEACCSGRAQGSHEGPRLEATLPSHHLRPNVPLPSPQACLCLKPIPFSLRSSSINFDLLKSCTAIVSATSLKTQQVTAVGPTQCSPEDLFMQHCVQAPVDDGGGCPLPFRAAYMRWSVHTAPPSRASEEVWDASLPIWGPSATRAEGKSWS